MYGICFKIFQQKNILNERVDETKLAVSKIIKAKWWVLVLSSFCIFEIFYNTKFKNLKGICPPPVQLWDIQWLDIDPKFFIWSYWRQLVSKGSGTECLCYSINAEFSHASVCLFAEILSVFTKGADSVEKHKFTVS